MDDQHTKGRRIPGLPVHWQNYLVCILFHMLLPLLPIGFELWSTGAVSQHSLTLATAMYAVTIGGSSRSRLIFGVSIVVSLFFAVVYGFLVGRTGSTPDVTSLAQWSLGLIFITHAAERYNRHVADRTPFWEF